VTAARTVLLLVVGVLVVLPWPVVPPGPVLSGFDPVVLTAVPRGLLPRPGRMTVQPEALELAAGPRAQPMVHLVTADAPFSATLVARILERTGRAYPLQVRLWNPRADAALEAWYGPDGQVHAGARLGERWLAQALLGPYAGGPGAPDRHFWAVRWEPGRAEIAVSAAGRRRALAVERDEVPPLFSLDPRALTLLATAPDGRARARVTELRVTLLPRDRRASGRTIPAVRLGMGLVALGVLWSLFSRWRRPDRRATDGGIRSVARWVRGHGVPGGGRTALLWPLLVAGAAAAAGVLLAPLPSHPLDRRFVEVWTHLAREGGVLHLLQGAQLATSGMAQGGWPYASMAYPYPPVLLYLFRGLAWMVPAAGAVAAVKAAAVAAGAVGGVLIFTLVWRLRGAPAAAGLAALAYALNPAVLFGAAVWGQTDTILLLWLLLAACGAALDRPVLFWVGLGLACLTKQTALLVLAPLLALGLARFGLRRALDGAATAALVLFVLVAPLLAAGVEPAVLYRPLLGKGLAFGILASPGPDAVVAQGGFPLWAILERELHGWERLGASDLRPSVLGPSPFLLGRLGFLLVTALLVGVAVRGARHPASALLVPAAALVWGAVLLTRTQPRYVALAVPFLAAALPWTRGAGALPLVAVTLTGLVGMWALMTATSVWYPGTLPAFHPAGGVHRWVALLATSDAGMAAGALLQAGAAAAVLALAAAHARTAALPWQVAAWGEAGDRLDGRPDALYHTRHLGDDGDE